MLRPKINKSEKAQIGANRKAQNTRTGEPLKVSLFFMKIQCTEKYNDPSILRQRSRNLAEGGS